MNSSTHRLIAIPRKVRLYSLHDLADQYGCLLKIDRVTGLPMIVDRDDQAGDQSAEQPASTRLLDSARSPSTRCSTAPDFAPFAPFAPEGI